MAIVRTFAAGPKLLMLDEPTEGIQPSVIKAIGRVTRMLADRRTMAIALVEQFDDFAAELADQCLQLECSEIVMCGCGAQMAADRVRGRIVIRGGAAWRVGSPPARAGAAAPPLQDGRRRCDPGFPACRPRPAHQAGPLFVGCLALCA